MILTRTVTLIKSFPDISALLISKYCFACMIYHGMLSSSLFLSDFDYNSCPLKHF